MKKLLLGTVAGVALIAANAASAADMGLPVKGRALEPMWNWSGFYAGLNAGYARSTSAWNDLDGTINGVGGPLLNESISGFTGGGQIGYNWQIRHAVIGIETDFNYLGLNKTTTFFVTTPPTVDIRDKIQWVGTVRGRAGLALDNVLLYLTAGLAYGQADHSFNDHRFPGPPPLALDFSATKIGFAAGFGTEYALDPRWSAKAEALYVDLGKNSATFPPTAFGQSTVLSGRFDVTTRCGSSAPA